MLKENIRFDDRDLTLVKCVPQTGRTHQIRVHLCAIKHCIIHDPIYNSKRLFSWSKGTGFTRLMLHAHKISLQISDSSDSEKEFVSQLPEEFTRFYEME